MKELQQVSEKIFELEQKKAKKKRDWCSWERNKTVKKWDIFLYEETSKERIDCCRINNSFHSIHKSSFDKDVFIANEGEDKYKKYLKDIQVERVTVKVANN